ncbi:DNA/RNA helicase [Microbacterium mangrovi]|uniref:DNA/RNA helicase n=1 Tax=Microbacterium mangrovi TaxID=1348253 RepID=A0A0B2A9S3_9MICO|nr:DEAD/DEAH box helicase [Microbacterium mangrovi]KHK98391.1 DNA/RNA helicase [Microbacterium mangrovi]
MNAPFVEPDAIRRQAWGGAFTRGTQYFHDGAVRDVRWDADARTITGDVAGSNARRYRCVVRLLANSDGIDSTRCSCPMEADCKHVVATLLASNAGRLRSRLPQPADLPGAAPGGYPRPVAPEPSRGTSWRDLIPATPSASPGGTKHPLALGVELRHRVQRSTRSWAPPTVEAVTPRVLATSPTGLLVGMRPLMRSPSTGRWIQGQVSWDAVRRPGGGYDDAHARWMAELYSIARDVRTGAVFTDVSDWLTLDTAESGLLWSHLAAARELGLPIVSTRKDASVVLADEPGSATLEISRAPGGGLRLTPRITIDGVLYDPAHVRPVGRTGVYAFTPDRPHIALTLAAVPLGATTAALLGRTEPVVVPPEDVDEFARSALPRLRRTGSVVAGAGYELPTPEPPRLVLEVAHLPGHTIEHVLRWRYGTRSVAYEPDPADDLRDPEAESALRLRVEEAWADAADLPFAASGLLHDTDAARFAVHVVPALRAIDGVSVLSTGTAPDYRELTDAPHIAISTVESTDRDWFDLGVVVTIDGRRIPFGALFTALSLRRKNMLLADGGYFSLAHPALQQLRDLIDEAAEVVEWDVDTIRVSRAQVDFWEEFEDLADESTAAVSWRATAEALRSVGSIEHTDAPAGLNARLRPYQQTGFDWLAFLWRHRLGGILADDMGLGKTLQMLAMVQYAREAGESRPFLVVAPTSVLSTWRSEAARFVPELEVAVLDATSAKRGRTVADAAAAADLVVTSYTLARLDEDEFAAVEWSALVLDEAQFVKNPRTKLHRAVKSFSADAVFAITGTPMENSLTELWALLSLTAPGLFASARAFREDYVGPIEQGKVPENQEGAAYREARLNRLRRRIRPLVLRRTKELVASDLPPKQEQELLIDLRPAHRALYDATLQRERQKVLGLLDDLDRNRFIVFRSLTLLRMLSLSPALIDPAHAAMPSAKLDALLEQLPDLAAEGHRALVFSQFTSFLDLAEDRLRDAGIPFTRLDGSTRDRGGVVDGFREGDAPVFLISLKAGGFGLTLTEADYVFLLDPWWNPAAEAQAIDRTHRIGQQRHVFVYRLIAAGTIEEKVLELQRRKARLFQSVMDDDALFAQALDADDIRGLFDA